jgi:hypothetical protein
MSNRTAKTWQSEASELFARAAELCVEHGVDLDAFVRGAYSAYLEARPGMREELADRQLAQQLDELRRAGRLASA